MVMRKVFVCDYRAYNEKNEQKTKRKAMENRMKRKTLSALIFSLSIGDDEDTKYEAPREFPWAVLKGTEWIAGSVMARRRKKTEAAMPSYESVLAIAQENIVEGSQNEAPRRQSNGIQDTLSTRAATEDLSDLEGFGQYEREAEQTNSGNRSIHDMMDQQIADGLQQDARWKEFTELLEKIWDGIKDSGGDAEHEGDRSGMSGIAFG